MKPSFAKDILDVVIPLLMQQHDVIYPFDYFTWPWTGRVSLRIIYRPPWSLKFGPRGSIAAVM